MVAHAEPVKSWGHKPCGKANFPTTTRVSAGVARRRARTGPGAATPRYKRSVTALSNWPTGAGTSPVWPKGEQSVSKYLRTRRHHHQPEPSRWILLMKVIIAIGQLVAFVKHFIVLRD